ncbi:hypothetical protein GCM10023313_17500 [Mucilaginibacter defluvii]|uniref:Uncharacterized protein n=2 Tax=Mucilaginibacter defluvii TaxID=1196019 RepID=A0ABP9FVD0_9SPHI
MPIAMDQAQLTKVYLTDLERNLTFFGIVNTLNEVNNNMEVHLTDVKVYEYESSNYLYSLPDVTFTRPKAILHIEAA